MMPCIYNPCAHEAEIAADTAGQIVAMLDRVDKLVMHLPDEWLLYHIDDFSDLLSAAARLLHPYYVRPDKGAVHPGHAYAGSQQAVERLVDQAMAEGGLAELEDKLDYRENTNGNGKD